MRAIQITMDEHLLHQLDSTEEVKNRGRSAVLRQATVEYLARQRKRAIGEGYAKAYEASSGLGEEFEGWEDQGQWPERCAGERSGSTPSAHRISADPF